MNTGLSPLDIADDVTRPQYIRSNYGSIDARVNSPNDLLVTVHATGDE